MYLDGQGQQHSFTVAITSCTCVTITALHFASPKYNMMVISIAHFQSLISLCLLWFPFTFVFPSAPSLLVLHLHKSRDPTVVKKHESSAGSRVWKDSMSSAAKALTRAWQALPVRTILSTPKPHAVDGEDYRQVNRQVSRWVLASHQCKAGVGNKELLQNPQASGKAE